jgi:hypothetical protein
MTLSQPHMLYGMEWYDDYGWWIVKDLEGTAIALMYYSAYESA